MVIVSDQGLRVTSKHCYVRLSKTAKSLCLQLPLQEAHEEFKKQKIAAHAAQLKKFEQTQSK